MKKKIKKAFTLVELLVVIAILAILATVSIVGYNSFTKKAKVSNDTTLVTQLNTLLKADSMVNGDAKTPTDALKITSEAGYDVEKLTPTASDYDIIWNQKTNQFALLDEKGTAVYGEKSTEEYKNWKFVSEYNTATDYSVYLKGTAFTGSLEVKAGVDVGNNTEISSITYTHTSGSKQEVAIRTNGGTLIVNGINGDNGDVVNHFNDASYVNVQSVGSNSYHEYGNVGFVNVVNGRVTVEKNAKVLAAYIAESTAKVDNNFGTIENAYAKANVTNTGNVTVTEVPSGKTIEDIKNEVDEKYNAVAIVDGVYQASLQATFKKAFSKETATIEILRNVDLSNTKWIPADMQSSSITKELIINGNNHTITGLNVHVASTNDPKGEHQAGASNFYGVGFIGRVGKNQTLKINDLTFTKAIIDDKDMQSTAKSHTSGVAVVIGISYGKTTLNNVNVSDSTVYGGEKVGAFIGFSVDYEDSIKGGSLSNTTITCTYYYSSLVVGITSTSNKPVITNINIINSSTQYDSNCIYSSKEIYVTENGDTYAYVDGYWMMVAYKFSIAAYGGTDAEDFTYNSITAKKNGHAYSYVKNGDLYSIN